MGHAKNVTNRLIRRRQSASRMDLPSQERPAELVHVDQPIVEKAIGQRSAFIRWYEKESQRLDGLSTSDDYEAIHTKFEQEREARTKDLKPLLLEAEVARRQRRQLTVPAEVGRIRVGEPTLCRVIPTISQSYEMVAYKKTTWGPIAAKPDDEHWVADFKDNEATLHLQYRFWLPGRGWPFTGMFAVSPRATASALVDIKWGGNVKIWVETGAALRRCTNTNTGHDAGFHYDPAYDTDLCMWESKCQHPENVSFTDTAYGLHPFGEEVDVLASAKGVAPSGFGHFLDVWQYLTVTAENALVYSELNDVGTVYTPRPRVTLWHYALLRPDD